MVYLRCEMCDLGLLSQIKTGFMYYIFDLADETLTAVSKVSPWSRVQTPSRAYFRTCNSVVRVGVL
jgi:hypothetical protein